jgi:SOS-response transcriptional repressor LexA
VQKTPPIPFHEPPLVGQTIAASRSSRPNNGDAVVPVLHGETIITRFYQRGTPVEWRRANAHMAMLEVEAQDVAVKGVVTGLIRLYEP